MLRKSVILWFTVNSFSKCCGKKNLFPWSWDIIGKSDYSNERGVLNTKKINVETYSLKKRLKRLSVSRRPENMTRKKHMTRIWLPYISHTIFHDFPNNFSMTLPPFSWLFYAFPMTFITLPLDLPTTLLQLSYDFPLTLIPLPTTFLPLSFDFPITLLQLPNHLSKTIWWSLTFKSWNFYNKDNNKRKDLKTTSGS